MAKASLQGPIRLLFSVPRYAIVKSLLTQNDMGLVQQAYSTLTGSKGALTADSLYALDRLGLIKVFEEATPSPAVAAKSLFEEHRYRGMKSLYIHDVVSLPDELKIDIAVVNKILAERVSNYRNQDATFFLDDVKLDSVEPLAKIRPGFTELSYSQVGVIGYTNPETEYPETVRDLRRGFAWLCPEDRWLAVCARDDRTAAILASVLEDHIGCEIVRLRLSKAVQQIAEPPEQMRRASFMSQKGTRRRITNPNLASDPGAYEEVRRYDKTDERPSSGYNVQLSDGTTFALGYAADQGKIYFSRDLTVSQLRGWGPGKVSELVGIVREMRVKSPDALVPTVVPGILRGVPDATRKVVANVALAIAQCKRDRLSEAELPHDAIGVYEDSTKYWGLSHRAFCNQCDEPTEIACSACARTSFTLNKKSLVCANPHCRKKQSAKALRCVHDHPIDVNSIASTVYLAPLEQMNDFVSKVIHQISDQSFYPDREFFHVRGSTLFFGASSQKTVYTVDEVPDLSALLEKDVPDNEAKGIVAALGQFYEKCDTPSKENCAGCVAKRVAPKCFMRLLGLFDPEYQPSPHHGHEFGDYHRTVTVDGLPNVQLLTAMKRSQPAKTTVKLRHGLGQDIYSQVATYRKDATVGLVLVPREPEFWAGRVSEWK